MFGQTSYLYPGTLSLTCNSGTKNVGDSATIRVHITNTSESVAWPVGVYVTFAVTNVGEADTEIPYSTQPGSYWDIDFTISSIPQNVSGQSLLVTAGIYESKATHDAGDAPIDFANCDGLLVVTGGAYEGEVTSMTVV